MTTKFGKFGNFAHFIVRNFVVIWEAPNILGAEKSLKLVFQVVAREKA